MTEYFIALDVHCAFSEMAVVTGSGKLVRRDRLDTTIPAIREAIQSVRRPRRLTFEEGPLADWLTRELRDSVNELVVCEPRRNHWIAKDGDKDDPLDARKLADLFRGGYLKPVHQADSLKRSLLKQHVGLYHDRVRERVRQSNQLLGLLRRHGVFLRTSDLIDPDEWNGALKRLPDQGAYRSGIQRIHDIFRLMLDQEEALREELIGLAQNEEPVRRFQELPGFGWIRAVTFYVFIDTPWRFPSKSALWRYCGVGLERRHSGQGPVRTRLSHRGNRQLKNVLMGAAKSAIAQSDNPFADKFQSWMIAGGKIPPARRNVARALAATLWGMWKSGKRYDPRRIQRTVKTER
jgi:transposase